MKPVAALDDALFLEHTAPPDHPERAERLLAVRLGLDRAAGGRALRRGPDPGGRALRRGPDPGGRALRRGPDPAEPGSLAVPAYLRLPVKDATDEQLCRVHDPAYVESLGHLAGRNGYLDADTYLSPGTAAAARRAAGSAVGLVDALTTGVARFGFALPRPPGHHALRDRAMGFCLLNNVAVAAAHARALGHDRVLVLDWDVHHGNGTEAMFFDDPSVLFVSLHQFPNYPGTGAVSDHGLGEGRGKSVNVPLPAGGTDAVYAAALQRIVLPIVEQFAPTLALVSCGFDAHERDPLAEMQLSAAGYAAMTRSLIGVLTPACPLGLVLEGGYDLEALADSTEAVARVLLGRDTPAPVAAPSALPAPHAAALQQIATAQAPYWKLA